ncbi:hypothetical protein AB0K00_28925 [Dactylosporangium sp. NPDC049525]|uniref:hypothetical protein n=1 Tax=Dactylosporangium sp. NPDC049525 TaxID=3154730 RepID=UPI00343974E6
MIERPSQRWQRVVAEEEAAVAAGTLPREEAHAGEFWPPEFIGAVEAALAAYEREIEQLPDRSDELVWAAVRRVVLALNDTGGDEFIETGEREELAGFIDQVLTAAGVDVEALMARSGGRDRGQLTDEWRDW